jgi:hypothetical protein
MVGTKAAKLLQKRNRPPEGESWQWFTIELLMSDAWRTAPIYTMRFVMRVVVEHLQHAGKENGNLTVTFDDCEDWGVDRKRIKHAQADAIRRGLVYRSQKGIASAPGKGRRPHKFGLGWMPNFEAAPAPNRWKGYAAPEPSRVPPRPSRRSLPHNLDSSGKNGTKLNGGNLRNSQGGQPIKVGETELVTVGKRELVVKRECPKNRNHNGLPLGWRWGKLHDGHVRALKPGTPGRPWIGVPVVEGTGDLEEQRAYNEYHRWRLNQLSERLTKVRPPDRVHPQQDGKPPASSGHFNA